MASHVCLPLAAVPAPRTAGRFSGVAKPHPNRMAFHLVDTAATKHLKLLIVIPVMRIDATVP